MPLLEILADLRLCAYSIVYFSFPTALVYWGSSPPAKKSLIRLEQKFKTFNLLYFVDEVAQNLVELKPDIVHSNNVYCNNSHILFQISNNPAIM